MVCSTLTGFAWMQQSTDCAFVYQKFIISGVGQRLSPLFSALLLRNLFKRRKSEVQFIEKIGQKRFGVHAIVGFLRLLKRFLNNHAREVKKVLQPPETFLHCL